MLIGAGDLYSLGASGGSKDAIVPYHQHSVSSFASGGPSNNTSGGMSGNATGAFTAYDYDGWCSGNFSKTTKGGTSFQWVTGNTHHHMAYFLNVSHTHSLQNHTHTVGAHNTNYAGSSGNTTNANLPPYRAVKFIICAL